MTLDERKDALEQQLADAERQALAWQQTAQRLIGALALINELQAAPAAQTGATTRLEEGAS